MTTKDTKAEASAYATGPDDVGKPAGPEHDKSFHVEDYYDEDGKRIATDWDTDAQKKDPGVEAPPSDSGAKTMTAAEAKEHRK